jgi:hypothetical protein
LGLTEIPQFSTPPPLNTYLYIGVTLLWYHLLVYNQYLFLFLFDQYFIGVHKISFILRPFLYY